MSGRTGTGSRTAGRLFSAVPTAKGAATVPVMSLLQIALISSIQRDRAKRGR